jgi:chromosome segregation ATPase
MAPFYYLRYEETTKFKKEQSSTIVEMKDHLHRLEAEQEKAIEDNERLYEQNVKLKEEMTTLITSFHSLKESHLTLQNTVQDLDTKMTESEKELERRAQKIAKLQGVKAELVMKTHEHVETLNQLKKLTQHMPSNAPTPKKKDKHLNPFLL